MTSSALSPLELAQESARIMWAEDTATRHVGMQLLEVTPGRAKLSLTVREEFTNGHGMCHGGYIFMLADSAFAFACNSHNQRAVAASASIEFIAAAQRGDLLTAECAEQSRGGRSGLYDTRVTDQNGRLIALFRGRSATIRGRFVEEVPT
ncbi:MAG: hydroxyphenylacetyl-CoA thioesterase PaaI [Burkholderiaceae bacterium]